MLRYSSVSPSTKWRRPPPLIYRRDVLEDEEEMGDERRQPGAGQTFPAAIMVSDGGGGSREAAGKKRKAESLAAMRREPRRGLGVAELERIRVALEVAERCYSAVPPLTAPSPAPVPQPPPALPPTAALAVVHGAAGLAAVGNGAAAHQQLQMPMGYFAPYHVAAQQYESFTRLFTSSDHPSPHQIRSAVATALPAAGQAASSESSSSAYQRRQSHRRRTQHPRQQPSGQTVPVPAPQQVAVVDLVDSDDDDCGGHVEELDLELRL